MSPPVSTTSQGCIVFAGLYRSQGRYEEAELLCVKALEILEVLLGKEHPDTKKCRNNLQSLRDL